MEGGIRLLTKEMIKPSSPTPHHLRNYSLSFLDQISPPLYAPFVFFYRSSHDTILAKSDLLKRSLSQVLSLYYPLAGRIKMSDNNAILVDCSDEGALYQEAEVGFLVSDVLLDHHQKNINNVLLDHQKNISYDQILGKLVPFQPEDHLDHQGPLLGVQFNKFRCGGVAVGVSKSHKLADAWSIVWFVKTWADIVRGDQGGAILKSPKFVGSELFPPRDISGYDPTVGVCKDEKKRNLVTTRFLFGRDSIESLRANYATRLGKSGELVLVPLSKVQTLTAFIWSRFIASIRRSTSTTTATHSKGAILQAVNLRRMMEPKLPHNSFGNLNRFTIITTPNQDQNNPTIIPQMKDAIAGISHKHYIKDLQHGTKHLHFIKRSASARHSPRQSTKECYLNFTSLCGFPLYEADFGWGKPAKTGHPSFPYTNIVMLVPASEHGDEIEAIVTLGRDDMDKFREDGELLRYASSSSSSGGEFAGWARL